MVTYPALEKRLRMIKSHEFGFTSIAHNNLYKIREKLETNGYSLIISKNMFIDEWEFFVKYPSPETTKITSEIFLKSASEFNYDQVLLHLIVVALDYIIDNQKKDKL